MRCCRSRKLSFFPAFSKSSYAFPGRFRTSNVVVANPYAHFDGVSRLLVLDQIQKYQSAIVVSVLTQKLREDHFHVRSSAFVSVFLLVSFIHRLAFLLCGGPLFVFVRCSTPRDVIIQPVHVHRGARDDFFDVFDRDVSRFSLFLLVYAFPQREDAAKVVFFRRRSVLPNTTQSLATYATTTVGKELLQVVVASEQKRRMVMMMMMMILFGVSPRRRVTRRVTIRSGKTPILSSLHRSRRFSSLVVIIFSSSSSSSSVVVYVVVGF